MPGILTRMTPILWAWKSTPTVAVRKDSCFTQHFSMRVIEIWWSEEKQGEAQKSLPPLRIEEKAFFLTMSGGGCWGCLTTAQVQRDEKSWYTRGRKDIRGHGGSHFRGVLEIAVEMDNETKKFSVRVPQNSWLLRGVWMLANPVAQRAIAVRGGVVDRELV